MAERALGSSVAAAPETTRRTRRLRVGVTAGVLVVAVLALLGAVFHHRIGHQLALSFVRQPNHYSEIYFTHPQALFPLVPAGSTQTAEFGVTNHTGSTRAYQWVVQESTNGGPVGDIAHGVLTVAAGRAASTTFQFSVTTARNRAVLVTVLLADLGEHIDFHTRTG